MTLRERPRPGRLQSPRPADWRAEQVARIDLATAPLIPRVRPADVRRISAAQDAWDAWPVQDLAGQAARIGGGPLWMTLAAPVAADPNLRHQKARIHLVRPTADGGWRDLGPAMPDGFSPGACEWSGCAVLRPDTGRVELHFTATGRRGQPFRTEQRLFVASARVELDGDDVRLTDWSAPTPTVDPQADWRQPAFGADPAPGFIHALRDPALFHDPDDGADYLVYAASLAGPQTLHHGAIGLAAADGAGGWRDLGPLVRAPGLNHELERPHLLRTADGVYLFWCTQSKMFAPGGPVGPTGLYGMFAPGLSGPYAPINGTGLVAANPPDAPAQTYAWWVTGGLDAYGFVDVVADAPPGDRLGVFAGGFAPPFRIRLDGPTSRMA